MQSSETKEIGKYARVNFFKDNFSSQGNFNVFYNCAIIARL